MLRTVIVGSGNLATNLIVSMRAAPQISLAGWASRTAPNPDSVPEGLSHIPIPGPLPQADLFLLAVSDRAIGELSRSLDYGDGIVLHTSGAQPMTALDPKVRRGVFYPLQTFTQSRPIGIAGVPVLLEAEHSADMDLLKQLVSSLGGTPVSADSGQRLQAHLAAVLANNFSNHLWQLAGTLLEETGLPTGLLDPLIRETTDKARDMGPIKAQTGPALRGDTSTLDKHVNILTDPNLRELYLRLTQSIAKTHGTEL